MTISIANVDTTSDTFGQWITKTNILADAVSNKVVTVNSNTATGNAAISGAFTSANLNVNYINGGNNTVYGNLTISTNTVFSSNAIFNGYVVKLGSGANVQVNTGNSTYRVMTVNSAAGNTLVATKIYLSADMIDVYTTGATNSHVLRYNTGNTTWYPSIPNTSILSDLYTTGATNNHVLRYNSANSTWYSGTTLIVYYANGVQAYP